MELHEGTGGTVKERMRTVLWRLHTLRRTAIVTRMSRGRSKVIIFHVRACACLYRVVRSRRGIGIAVKGIANKPYHP